MIIHLPGSLHVGFDEALELHRAVSGRDVSVADFVESLVAESMAGAEPADVFRVPLKRARPVEEIERELDHGRRAWNSLDEIETPADPLRGPRDRRFERLHRSTLELLDRLERGLVPTTEGTETPAVLDGRMRQLIKLENRIERQLGELLAYMKAKRAWLKLGFAGVGHYGSERLSISRRSAQDRSRVASELRHHPLLRDAYERDRIGLESALLVLRVLGPRRVMPWIERAWVKRAIEVSVKRLRDEVRVARLDWTLNMSMTPPAPLNDEEWQGEPR